LEECEGPGDPFPPTQCFIQEESQFSVNDLGCGFGDFSSFVQKDRENRVDYRGYDNVSEMIELACQKYPARFFRQIQSPQEMLMADYTVASGIFNKTFSKFSEKDWWDFMLLTIRQMYEKSTQGIAFNALTSYSDKQFMRADLYYCDPCRLFDFCKRNLSRNVTLLHDYDLYDFTILVKKEAYFQ
jgi:hypothetical protein